MNKDAVYGALVSICLALATFSLKWTFDTNAEMKVMNERQSYVMESLDKMSQKSELDKKQDSQLSKHWTLHGWARDEINKLRHVSNLEPAPWPNLSLTLGGWED